MTPHRLEHANLNFADLDRATRLLQALVPTWRVRGEGVAESSDGVERWRHVGDDFQYVAVYESAPDAAAVASPCPAFNHLGFVVDDLDAALARLAALGVPLDHVGGATTHRRSAYVRIAPEGLEIELVQYTSAVPAERNVYPEPAPALPA